MRSRLKPALSRAKLWRRDSRGGGCCYYALLTFSPGGPIGPWGPIRPWKKVENVCYWNLQFGLFTIFPTARRDSCSATTTPGLFTCTIWIPYSRISKITPEKHLNVINTWRYHAVLWSLLWVSVFLWRPFIWNLVMRSSCATGLVWNFPRQWLASWSRCGASAGLETWPGNIEITVEAFGLFLV